MLGESHLYWICLNFAISITKFEVLFQCLIMDISLPEMG
jgi:hypothetical protein